MATFLEIHEIISNSVPGAQELRDKIQSAVIIAADTITKGQDNSSPFSQTAPAPEQRRLWAPTAYRNPIGTANDFLPAVVAANSTASQADILGAPDFSIQQEVNEVVDIFAGTIPVQSSPPAS